MKQLNLLTGQAEPIGPSTSTFVDNMSLPIHRWFRYSAGFSGEWVRGLIEAEKVKGRRRVLDPFAGSGTVLLEGEHCGIDAIGIEAHPFVARIAQAKLNWSDDPKRFRTHALSVLDRARGTRGGVEGYPKVIEKCFPPETLSALDALKKAWKESDDGSALSELTWLALISILRECSPAGTAPWQYVLPNKRKAKTVDPYTAFESKVHLMSADMALRQRQAVGVKATLLNDDARACAGVGDSWADLVITSPPYANNYDYADATRLEMSFLGEVQGWGDLQDAVRKHLIRSCTQHVAKLTKLTDQILGDPVLGSISSQIREKCRLLEIERADHGGKKPYHTMVAAYFSDMGHAWKALRRVTRDGSLVCFVVGDSAPYGIHVPVERWLGELAIDAGFRSYSFEKVRDRNVKWKNRKHRVPLQEGYLWVNG